MQSREEKKNSEGDGSGLGEGGQRYVDVHLIDETFKKEIEGRKGGQRR